MLVALVVVMVMATGANELANQTEHSTVQSTHLHMPNMSISSASISLLSSLFFLSCLHTAASRITQRFIVSVFCFGILYFGFGFGFVLVRSKLAISFGLTHFRHASQKWAPHATDER